MILTVTGLVPGPAAGVHDGATRRGGRRPNWGLPVRGGMSARVTTWSTRRHGLSWLWVGRVLGGEVGGEASPSLGRVVRLVWGPSQGLGDP